MKRFCEYSRLIVRKLILIFFTMFLLVSCNSKYYNNFEIPAVGPNDNIIFHTGFTVSYDTATLIPKWVAYELTAEEAQGEFPRSKTFCSDPDFNGRQAIRDDYSNSGWDKGHMAPAADMKWSEESMLESFYLTNICPQNHSLNERDWQTLEKKVRGWAFEYGCIYVVCGPIIGANQYGTIGANRVVVPDAFFKALMVPEGKSYKTIAFIMMNSNERHSIKEYALSVNELEKITGIDFFPHLNDREEELIENQVNCKSWNIN